MKKKSGKTELITKIQPLTITEADLLTTMTKIDEAGGQRRNGDHTVKVGDRVTSTPKRNFNTPLFIKADGLHGGSNVRMPKLPIPANAYVRVFLEREVNSANLRLPVTAVAYTDMTNNGNVLIPKGSSLVGKVDNIQGNRLGINFATAVFPDGKEYAVRGNALGEDNAAGVAGNVDYHLMGKGSTILTSSLLDAASTTLHMNGRGIGSVFAGNIAGQTSDSMNDTIQFGARDNGISVNVPMNTRFVVVFQ